MPYYFFFFFENKVENFIYVSIIEQNNKLLFGLIGPLSSVEMKSNLSESFLKI